MREEITKSLQNLRKAEKRNFTQSIDLIIALKDLDLKKTENRFSEDFILPKGRGKDAEVIVFSDNLSDLGCDIFTSEDIQKTAGNKRDVKKLANKTDFFLAEPPLMPLIGKSMGQALAPRNKMPKLITGNAKKMVDDYKKRTRVILKSAPVIQCLVGKEDMPDGEIVDNVEGVLKLLETKLPRGRHNMGKVFLKFTMSKPVNIEVK